MRTTMAMVYNGLSERFSCEKGEYYDPDTIISLLHATPSVCDAESGNGAIVICGGLSGDGEYPFVQIPSKRVIEVCSPSQLPMHPHAISVTTDVPVSEVIRVAEDALCRYRSWSNDLANSVLEGATLERLVDEAHILLGNPIIVLDRALRVRVCTIDDVMNDEMWTPLDSHAEAFAGPADAPGFVDFLTNLEKDKVISDYLMFNGIHLASCRTRDIGGDFLFACLIQKNRKISESDVQLLQFLCLMIEAVQKTSQSLPQEGIGFNGLLVDAFEGRLANPIELDNRMRTLGYTLKPRVRVIVSMPLKGHLNEKQAYRLMNSIPNNFPFCRGIYHRGALVFFASYDQRKGPTASDFKKFGVFLDNCNLIAGVSEEYSSAVPLQELYQTALYALRIGRKILAQNRLFFFDECRPYYLWEICSSEGDASYYIHPSLKILALHDERSKSPLYPTFKCLVLNWGNRTKTAKELFIQRNTLQARIREIEELCGVDLSDPKVVTHIRNSFVLEDYCSRGIR